ncbi:MAG: NAD-dependent epimerase/dehydratase family protein [Calditrichia bacterium]
MANIFLTGATGFVGSFVAEALIKNKHRVTCLVRSTSNLRWLENLPVKINEGELLNPESYRKAVESADRVIHVAGVTKAADRQEYYQGNVEATRLLLETIRAVNSKLKSFLLVSSQAAVGPSTPMQPLDESAPFAPLTDYGKSKMEAELLAREYMAELPLTIVRPPVVYGPRDTDVLIFFKNIQKGLNLQVGKLDQLVSLVYVEDLARGIMQAALSDYTPGETYFICDDRPFYWSQVAALSARIMQKKYWTVRFPLPLVKGAAWGIEQYSRYRKKPSILNRQKMQEINQENWVVDPSKAQEHFGYETRFPLVKGMENTIDWYKKAGWL